MDEEIDKNVKKGHPKLNVLPVVHEEHNQVAANRGRFPSWLHRKMPTTMLNYTKDVVHKNRVHTVCEEAKCPNLVDCFSRKTATFLLLGRTCTRACGFCEIDFSKNPAPPDKAEPERIKEAVKLLGLKHVVLTMVARDDLEDGGAEHICKVVQQVRSLSSDTTVELLTSDFSGNQAALNRVLDEGIEIFNHNMETVEELSPRVRHKATYSRSLTMLAHAKKYSTHTLVKSGIMVGLGETKEQVKKVLHDLAQIGCDIVTIGQYLQASNRKLRVMEFIHPDVFKEYEEIGLSYGIRYVYSGPFVRSSFNANIVFENAGKKYIISSE